MNSLMAALGWASVMLCVGMTLRARLGFLRRMLVPASVVGGIIGMVLMNVLPAAKVDIGIGSGVYTDIVNNLFTISFISISLAGSAQGQSVSTKEIMRGAVGMGMVWCLLYALTPIIAAAIIGLVGERVGMDCIYGFLIQFAFCQGPGQSAAYGAIFEQFGIEDASMTAIAFSAIGFIVAFMVGIPAAKAGITKGIARHCGKLDESVLRGYLKKQEQTEYMIKDTTCNSNIETLSFHFALIGVSYVLAVGISKILSRIPGFLGTSMGSMMFMNGMYAAYIVKWIMKKLRLDFLQENILQSKITGWTADFLVVCAFMAVSFQVIKKWLIVILLVSAVITVITFMICFYFGQRFGGDNDFERMLGLYGTCTGTVPSGIALVRIVDPDFHTQTSIELGACNLVMLASTPVYIIILALAAGSVDMASAMLGLAGCAIVYLIVLKVAKLWGNKTFSWNK